MPKIRIVNRFVNPYAGAHTCMEELHEAGLHRYLDEQLGARVKQARYSFSDIILSWAITNYCHGKRLEDITHTRTLFNQQGLKFPSSDTLSRCIRKFATSPLNITSKFGKTHQFNFNTKLNNLLIDVGKKLDLLHCKTGAGNMLDYDGTLIPCEKRDSTFTYKQFNGYAPACAFIGNVPVYIEGRSGHTPAGFRIKESIESCFDMMDKNGIRVDYFRSDSAAYTKKTIEYLNTRGILFYIRGSAQKRIIQMAPSPDLWEKVKIDGRDHSVCSLIIQFGKSKKLRYVMQIDHAVESAKPKADDGTARKPTIRIVVTNDHSLSAAQVIKLYNARGKAELNFSALKGDFGWSRLPHSALNENVCFMYLSALVHVLYTYLIGKFSGRKLIEATVRLKKFIVAFVERAGWIDGDVLMLCASSKPPPG